MKWNKKIQAYITAFMTTVTLSYPQIMAHAQSVENVESKLKGALSTIQGVLTGLVVAVGVVVSIFIIITGMPSARSPQEKDAVYKSLGQVLALVAIAAAIVWVLPWVYGLFT